MSFLTIIRGPDRGVRFELSGQVETIGRDAKCSVRLHDQEASRAHAEFRATGDGTQLVDLNSSNGTFVNGIKVQKTVLHSGDRVVIGQSEMVFQTSRTGESSADLASLINMIGRGESGSSLGSAIVRSMTFVEGSKLLARQDHPEKPWLNQAVNNLAALYESSEAVVTISDMDRLFDRLLELIMSNVPATRGCIMIRKEGSTQLEPVAHEHRGGDPSEKQISISQTIADHVLRSSEGIIVVNATTDQRFRESASVIQQGIREAICVPLRGRHDTMGVIYVDTRTETIHHGGNYQFSEDHLRLLIAIAHYAALAFEDHRFYQAMLDAERLAAIGQTMANVSHHIKNILQGLKSGSYLVDLGINENNTDLLKQGWATVQRNQDRIFNLVLDMLSYSKERTPNLQACELNSLLSEVVDLVRSLASDHHVSLNWVETGTPINMLLDPEGIHRAMLNLLTNAIEACSGREGASVTVTVDYQVEQHKVNIMVIDTGTGIDSKVLGDIFKVFFSTKGSKGTGLGLAVTQAIVREHGGLISVQSDLGKGTSFQIELPVRGEGMPAGNPS